jgi:hypothetical protein
MLDLAATSESLRQSHRSSLERLVNSKSRQVALFGAAALAIFSAAHAASNHSAPARSSRITGAQPAILLPAMTAPPATQGSRIGGLPVRSVQELRP